MVSPHHVNSHDTELADRPDSRSQDRHPHWHAFTHGLGTAAQVYGDTIASLVMSERVPAWQHAVDEYDRTHPQPQSPVTDESIVVSAHDGAQPDRAASRRRADTR